jgi:hypothetical protein
MNPQAYRKALAGALYAEALAVDAKATENAPVDTGRLRQSHYVKPPEGTDDPAVRLGFGVTYALPVHENHPDKAQFLQRPVDEARMGFSQRLARRVSDYRKRKLGPDDIPKTAPEGYDGDA